MGAQIIFARHGESTANLTRTFANRSEGFPLTELGRGEATELAERLTAFDVATLLTSPLLRARDTARIVGEILGIEPRVEAALREWDVGRWEASSAAEGWAEYEAVTRAWVAGDHAAAVGGGESLSGIRTRTAEFFEGLPAHARLGTVVCIGHGGIYRGALPGRLVNVTLEFAFAQPFPNIGWVVAEEHGGKLACVEWCGVSP